MTEDTVPEFLKKDPLVRFSVYTQVQVQTLWSLGIEIRQIMDNSIKEGLFVSGGDGGFHLIYGRFWLWVLGAYEVTRTMSEYKSCFSARHNGEVAAFKAQISVLRMPFAKLQFKGNGKPINGEASIHSIDMEKKDLSFQVGDATISMRNLIDEFQGFTQLVKHRRCSARPSQGSELKANPSFQRTASSGR